MPAPTPDKKIDTAPRPRRRKAKIRQCFQSVSPILRVRLRSSHASIAVAVKIHRAPWPIGEGGSCIRTDEAQAPMTQWFMPIAGGHRSLSPRRRGAKVVHDDGRAGPEGAQARRCVVSSVPFAVMNDADDASILSEPPSQGRGSEKKGGHRITGARPFGQKPWWRV